MFQSVLLAGFVFAAAAVTPVSTVSPAVPVAGLHLTSPSVAPVASKPALMASVPHTALPFQVRQTWEMPSGSAAASDAISPEEAEFVEKVNGERTRRGLNALSIDPLLVRTARGHSREMCARDYFDHHSPTSGLTTPMDRYLKGLHDGGGATPDSLLVGENIYYCSIFNDVYNVDYGHRALMDSPGHRANILEPRFTRIGLGIYRNARGEFWVTEMFLRDTDY